MPRESYKGWTPMPLTELVENLCYIEDLCSAERRAKCDAEKKCRSTHDEDRVGADYLSCRHVLVTAEALEKSTRCACGKVAVGTFERLTKPREVTPLCEDCLAKHGGVFDTRTGAS